MRRYVLAVFAIVLAVAGVFLAKGITIPPESILVPDMSIITNALSVVPAIALVLLSILLLRWSDSDRKMRITYWGILLIVVVASVYLLSIDPIVATFIVATTAGGFLALWTEDPCKRGVWHTVSSPKAVGFVLAVFMLTAYGSAIAPQIKPALVDKIVSIALSGAGNTNVIDLNQIVPSGITPEERAEIVASVERSVPNWNSLTKEQQQALINQYIQQYLGIKEGIRRALEKSIQNPDKEQLRQAILQQIESMPIFQTLLQNIQYLFAFVGAMLYSIISLFAEWVAFLVGALLNLVGRFDTRKKEQD